MGRYLTKGLQSIVYVALVFYLTYFIGLRFFYSMLWDYLMEHETSWVLIFLADLPVRLAVELVVPIAASVVVLTLFPIHVWPRFSRLLSLVQGGLMGLVLGLLVFRWMGSFGDSWPMFFRLSLVPAGTTAIYATMHARKNASPVPSDV